MLSSDGRRSDGSCKMEVLYKARNIKVVSACFLSF